MAKLFVNGVNPECPREAVVAVFSLCGEVTDIYIQPSIGFAFVTMADVEGASLHMSCRRKKKVLGSL